MSKRQILLTILIFVGLLAGVAVGQFVLFDPTPDDPTEHVQRLDQWKSLGELILIRPLMLIVVPLIFVSIVVGIAALGDPARLCLVAGASIVYYLATMLIAVIIGVVLVTNIDPGDAIDASFREAQISRFGDLAQEKIAGVETDLGSAWMNLVEQIIPENFLGAALEGRILSIITFAVLLGLALTVIGQRGQPAQRVFEALHQAFLTVVQWILWLTPVGVFLLTAWSVGELGLAVIIGPVGLYALTVIAGLLLHALVVLPLALSIFGKCNPYRFLWRMKRALLVAFGTGSSTATLPVTLKVAEQEAGCSRTVSGFVLSLGSTVNMDGTALFKAVAVVFLFQAFGIQLAFPELLIVVMTATLAAVGTAGIPSGGLVTLVIVITAVNTALGDPEKSLSPAAIGLILGIDRILDMCRTTVNVWGDAVGARIMTRLAPDEPLPTTKSDASARSAQST